MFDGLQGPLLLQFLLTFLLFWLSSLRDTGQELLAGLCDKKSWKKKN